MARDHHRKPFNEGTLVKLDIFGGHIISWLSVFIGSEKITKKNIRIFDFFCGPGLDSKGQKGSPVRILESLQSLSAPIRRIGYRVEVYLNDADPNKITELKETLAERNLLQGPYTLYFSSKDFLDALDERRPEMQNSANLLLLDQNGVRFFTADIFQKIRNLPVTDVLVFMSSSYVLRFKDEPEINQYLEANQIFIEKTAYHRVHRAIVNYYRTLIPDEEDYFLAPFSIKSGSNIHGIIFGSSNLKGLEKFLETAWKIDKVRGEADYDIDQEGIVPGQSMLFEEMNKPKKTTLFEQRLEGELLAGNLPDTGLVYKYVLQQGFLVKHASPVLRRLKQIKRIDGNLSGIGYSSLKSPEPIRLVTS